MEIACSVRISMNNCAMNNYGKRLIDYSLEQAEKRGFGAVAITGNIEGYGKSGFLDEVTGTFRDSDGYFFCQNDSEGFEVFESTFTEKEEKKLPGQLF